MRCRAPKAGVSHQQAVLQNSVEQFAVLAPSVAAYAAGGFELELATGAIRAGTFTAGLFWIGYHVAPKARLQHDVLEDGHRAGRGILARLADDIIAAVSSRPGAPA